MKNGGQWATHTHKSINHYHQKSRVSTQNAWALSPIIPHADSIYAVNDYQVLKPSLSVTLLDT